MVQKQTSISTTIRREDDGMTRKIPFKPDMKRAILDGRKTMTTRTTRHPPGEYEAYSVGGVFARIRIVDVVPTDWLAVSTNYFREEGFESTEQMNEWCKAQDLGHYATRPVLFRHTFELICPYCCDYPTVAQMWIHKPEECNCAKPCGAGGCPKEYAEHIAKVNRGETTYSGDFD